MASFLLETTLLLWMWSTTRILASSPVPAFVAKGSLFVNRIIPKASFTSSSPSSVLWEQSQYRMTTTTFKAPPHSGCHFRPVHPGILSSSSQHSGKQQRERFFEGWYYRVTLPPPQNVSFAFIYSIEDPQNPPTSLSLACQQIMGPDDEYLVQADPDPCRFWAWTDQQALGYVFDYTEPGTVDLTTTTVIEPDEFFSKVSSGFQMLPTRLQGRLRGHDGSKGGVLPGQGVEGSCQYDMTVQPIAGWGDDETGPKSTAGWLASYKVFEPHWQVTLADARASGSITWKNTSYEFQNAPFYAEKNWGGAFPTKWYWCQCNSFLDGWSTQTGKNNTLSVTAGGGTRKIPLGKTESLGMVSVHCNGIFYEATPWLGTMEWDISPWGYWKMTGRSTKGLRPFEVELEATCDSPGVKLRAPTETDGMVYFCRDSFLGDVTLSLWKLEWDETSKTYVRGAVVVDRARSSQAALEVGGGPWWDHWKAASNMKQPMRGLVRLPYRISNLRKRIQSIFTPRQ